MIKRTFIFTTLIMLCASFAFSQKKMSVEQTLMNIEQEMADAMVKNDMSVFEKYAIDNGAFTDPSGMLMSKSQLIAQFKSGDLRIESTKIDDMKVQVFDKTAIVTYRTTDKGKYKTQVINGQVRWTDVFVKMGNKWVVVASQGTPIMQQ